MTILSRDKVANINESVVVNNISFVKVRTSEEIPILQANNELMFIYLQKALQNIRLIRKITNRKYLDDSKNN